MASGIPSKSAFGKIGQCFKHKQLKVMVLGQTGVGKTALVVRFITKRFIGDYDPTLEKVYSCDRSIGSEIVHFEILDTAGQTDDKEWSNVEANVRWADVFILMYSITDKCSFDECNRLKFLINHTKVKKRLHMKEGLSGVPVAFVGNKTDQIGDRMVSYEEGQERSNKLNCISFQEISVRESAEEVQSVFNNLWYYWKLHKKRYPELKKSWSETSSSSHDAPSPYSTPRASFATPTGLGRRWTDVDLEKDTRKVRMTCAEDNLKDLTQLLEGASNSENLQEGSPTMSSPMTRRLDRQMSRGNT